ncbi:MAG: KH domain-containing protein [Patescibacteria group bacterium]|nr:KH domain-containing protein [Patescibacteria group bacterium]
MEARVSEVLENILGLLALEGSFEVVEGPEEVTVSIETSDAGRLIGFKGETLDALQLIVNQIVSRQGVEEYKRVVIDVAGWRKSKEGDLERRARNWADEVKENGQEIELEPMPAWQRRVIHMVVSEIPGVESESMGEGRERHLVIKPASKGSSKKKEQPEKPEEDAEKTPLS